MSSLAQNNYTAEIDYVKANVHRMDRRYIQQNKESKNLCRYLICFNESALKRNGQYHTLCQYHRVKQNQNQRKSTQRLKNSGPAAAIMMDSPQHAIKPQ